MAQIKKIRLMKKFFILLAGVVLGMLFYHILLQKKTILHDNKMKMITKDTVMGRPDSISTGCNAVSLEFLGLYINYLYHSSSIPANGTAKNKAIRYTNTYDSFDFISIYKKNDEFYDSFIRQNSKPKILFGNGKIVEIPEKRPKSFQGGKFFEIEGEYVYLSFKYLVNKKDTTQKCPVIEAVYDYKHRPSFICGSANSVDMVFQRVGEKCLRYGVDRDIWY